MEEIYKKIEINFEQKTYLNTEIHIIEFKNVIHLIKFADNYKVSKKKVKDIFEDQIEDTKVDWLEEQITKEKKNGKDLIKHEMKNLPLFKHTSLSNFVKMINSVCKCKISDLRLKTNIKGNFKNDIPDFFLFSDFLTVGNSSLHFVSDFNLQEDYGNQLVFILPWLIKSSLYVNEIIEFAKKEKNISLEYNITSLTITFYSTNKGVILNLPELFNLHSTNNIFNRVIIHDELIDIYNNNVFFQYVKQNKYLNLTTKHVIPKTNTLTLYYSQNISDDVILESIDVLKNGTFKLNLKINGEMDLEKILISFDNYLNNDFLNFFNLLHLNEINIGSNNLNFSDYYKQISNIVCVYVIPDNNRKDIQNLNKIFIFDEIESRFNSNTSINFNQFSFINEATLFMFEEEKKSRNIISQNNFKARLVPEMHYTLDPTNNLILTCSRFSSIEELKYALAFTLPLSNYTKIIQTEKTENLFEEIIARGRKLPSKTNLKQLTSKDPKLFAPRIVDKRARSYSALCQKKEHRPVLINKKSYEYLDKIIPESVLNIQNQTYQNQRLYLLCPFEEFNYINYHHFNGQGCIIKCTSRLTNQTQYNHCSKELDAIKKSEFTNKFQNLALIYYNEYIDIGRKCYLPNEIKYVFPEFILFKPDLKKINIVEYCHKEYNLTPYVIKRDSINKSYILLTDFDVDCNYMLCFETENTNECLIFLHETTNEVLDFNKYKLIKNFFQSFIKNNPKYQQLIGYICNHVLTDYSKKKENFDNLKTLTLYEFLNVIQKKYNCLIVHHNNMLKGIIKIIDGIEYYYPIPEIDWLNIEKNFIDSETFIKKMNSNSIKYPTFEMIYGSYEENLEEIFKIIVKPSNDNNKKINAVLIDDEILMCCQEHSIDEETKYYKKNEDYLIYDSSNYYLYLFSNTKKLIKVNSIISKKDNIYNFIHIYLEKYIHKYPNYHLKNREENIKMFLEYLDEYQKKNGIIYDDENKFDYITNNTISIENSRMNKTELIQSVYEDENMFKEDEINKYLYNKLMNVLNLKKEFNETIIAKPFI